MTLILFWYGEKIQQQKERSTCMTSILLPLHHDNIGWIGYCFDHYLRVYLSALIVVDPRPSAFAHWLIYHCRRSPLPPWSTTTFIRRSFLIVRTPDECCLKHIKANFPRESIMNYFVYVWLTVQCIVPNYLSWRTNKVGKNSNEVIITFSRSWGGEATGERVDRMTADKSRRIRIRSPSVRRYWVRGAVMGRGSGRRSGSQYFYSDADTRERIKRELRVCWASHHIHY